MVNKIRDDLDNFGGYHSVHVIEGNPLLKGNPKCGEQFE